ncbi:MAG: T9SS type A sorting domain-containing protein, partial [Bacteroidetes bacterium]|nr:T9SS type A sorting domain-containing protein [Bacteroidota bacterium]
IPKVYGCTDTGSINYNASANVNNGTCIPKVYGVMDTACRNYNPQANVNSGVCQPNGVAEIGAGTLSMDVVPNPFTTATTIYITSSEPLTAAQLRFYDQLGRVVDQVAIATGTKQLEYTNASLAAGVYDVALVRNESIIVIRKVVIEK